jgi:hypothetical protein
MTKILLIVFALVEAAAGLALLYAPAVATSLKPSAPVDTSTGLVVGRIAGAALLCPRSSVGR